MNKMFSTVALLGVILLSGCVKPDEGIYPAVEFEAVVRSATKTIVTGTTYPADESFTVNSYFSENNFLSTLIYMQDVVVSKQGSETVWRNASDPYYWPLTGWVKFFAYSPSDITSYATSVTANSSNGVVATGYQISVANNNLTEDFMYSTATVDVTTRTIGTPVSLAFSHALTQVCFAAKLAADYTSGTNEVAVAIKSISLGDIYSTGNFQQNPMGWKNQSGLSTYSIPIASNVDVPYVGAAGTPVAVGSPVLMIPQSMPIAASVTVVYSVTQFAGTASEYSDDVTKTFSITNDWAANSRVTYILNVTLNSITFDVSNGAWDSSVSGEIII